MAKLSRRSLLALASLGALAGCTSGNSVQQHPTTSSTSSATSSLSTSPTTPPSTCLRAEVARLLHVGVTDTASAVDALEMGVGGIFITGWADPAIFKDLPGLHQSYQFLASVDFEGGRVQRHTEVLGTLPAPGEMSKKFTSAQVHDMAATTGASLRKNGLTVDFAPVLDVDGNELEVVGDRSFSQDPHTAGEYGAAFAQGLLQSGVIPVYKHFPGHGWASGDSHMGAVVTPPLDQLLAHDLRAFSTANAIQPAPVMVGHMMVSGLGENVPASLNVAAYDLLREDDYTSPDPQRKFAITDDLSGMAAITDTWALKDAVLAALKAGADQALWSEGTQIPAVIDELLIAIDQGKLKEDCVRESAARVDTLIASVG